MNIEQAKENNANWKDVPVYKRSGSYAREHGELELYRSSFNANNVCRQVIESVIAASFDGFYLASGCEMPVVELFGIERVCYVLAITLQEKEYDGRFSRENREWAKRYPVADDPGSIPEMKNRNIYHVVNSHSAVLDGFVTRIRRMCERKEK